MLEEENHFVLDQEVGKAKEVQPQDVGGTVKIKNYEQTKIKSNIR